MPRLQIETRKRIIILRPRGHSILDIYRRLNEEGTEISVQSLKRLCVKFEKMHTIQDLLSKTRLRLLTEEMLSAMDQILTEDDEATARRLRATLCEKLPSSPEVSLATIKRLVNHFLHFTLYALYGKVSKENWVGVYMTPLLPTHQGSE